MRLSVWTSRLLALAGFLLLPSLASAAPSQGDFFKGPEVPQGLDPQGIYPQGRRMHLGAYSPSDRASRVVPWLTGMERLARAGFTVAGPDYSENPEIQFAKCRAAAAQGLRFAVQCPQPPALKAPPVAGDEASKDNHPLNNRPQRMAAIPEAELRQHVRSWMDPFLQDPALDAAVSSWAVTPEELRPWKKEEAAYLTIFSDEVRQHDPKHRPVFMYEPNHRSAQDLAGTRGQTSFLLMGLYTSTYGWTPRRLARINWAMDQILAECQVSGRLPVAGLELSQDLPGFSEADLEADPAKAEQLSTLIQHDAWLALARGAKAIQVWSWHEARPHYTTNILQVAAYAKVMQALTGPADLQKPFLFGERRDDLKLEVAGGTMPMLTAGTPDPHANDGWIKTGEWPAVRLVNVALAGSRTVMVVNSSLQPVSATVSGFPTGWRCEPLVDVAGAVAIPKLEQGALAVTLPPLGVWIGRIQSIPIP